MKVALSLVVVGMGLASWLVGVYATDPTSSSAGPAAGLAVLGGGMSVTGWIRMLYFGFNSLGSTATTLSG